jgi:two-component system, cell cycle sensor histidine kinase and response regulator CckA
MRDAACPRTRAPAIPAVGGCVSRANLNGGGANSVGEPKGDVPDSAAGAIRRLLLVVEDDPGDARLLREMFNEVDAHNTELTHVACMIDAEKYLAECPVDIILLDLGLPDAQGLDAVRRARAVAPNIPLVVLTGLDDESVAVQALQQGAQDYLIKGRIDAHGLLRALRYAIERKTMEDAGKAAENQLLQAQKVESLGRLAGGIAHDFNNLLFAVHGYAELLSQDLGSKDADRLDPERLLLSVNEISLAAERATALTAQLLAFSRRQIVTMNVLDVNAAVAKIEPMVRQLIGEDLQLIVSLDPGAGHICADGGQIDQILVNLVVNARDAMPDGGTVTIESGNAVIDAATTVGHAEVTPGSYVYLAVRDTGVGMDRATREHIFEPFFTTKSVGRGTGLGLATTHGIVTQAGGHIAVESEPGNGSGFTLYFPRVEGAVDERPPVPAAKLVGAGRVLVVEDDPAVRDITTRFLERAGYEVKAVADGTEAIAAAGLAPPFDVLVTDIVMPNMSGIELAEQMMDQYPLVGVVLLSGYTTESRELNHATERGATFLLKPVTSTQLLHAVLRGIASRRATAESQAVS